VHPERENSGYAYEKRAPPNVGMGPRIVNPAMTIDGLVIFFLFSADKRSDTEAHAASYKV